VTSALRRLGLIALSAIGFLAAWKALVVFGGYPEYILPAPDVVALRAVEAVRNGALQPHLTATLEAAVVGFASGAVVAISMGILLAKSLTAERVLSPYLVAAQAIPILALAPLVDIWFGSGLTARVVICALIVFFPIAIATIVGIRSTDPLLVEMARANGASNAQITRLLELPSALPVLFGGLRVGVTLAVVGAVVAEWAGASIGLGVLINIADQGLFDTPLMFVALASLAVLGLTFYGLVLVAERVLIPR
jgi:putative riboflavin transport system permease protein